MIILRIQAALGNQLFQYAYAKALSLRSNTSLMIDTSWYKNIAPRDTPRVFLLDKYCITGSISEKSDGYRYGKVREFFIKQTSRIRRIIFKENAYTYYPRLARAISTPDALPYIIQGWWNVPKYFIEYSDILRNEFRLKVPLSGHATEVEGRLKDLVATGNILVSIHVRRGDYITNTHASSYHGAQSTSYYEDALKELAKRLSDVQKQKTSFVLSSDDVDFINTEIRPLIKKIWQYNQVLIQDSQIITLSDSSVLPDYEEMYLMSLCHHFIIANSTFSWWAAWLSETAEKSNTAGVDSPKKEEAEKIVIGPKQWVRNPAVKTPDVLMPNWIRV